MSINLAARRRPEWESRKIDHRELYVWAIGILSINYLVASWVRLHISGTAAAWLTANGFSAFDAIGCAVALWRVGKAEPEAAGRNETAAIVALCILGGLPSKFAAPAALTLLGGWLLTRRDIELRAAASVLLALAGHQLWGKLAFNVTAPEVVKFDSALVGRAVTLTVRGASWHDNIISVGGHAIAVLEGCSSFTNASAAVLAWVALTKLERANWVRRDLLVGAAVVLIQIVLNVARMYLMALSDDLYVYWHNGTGAEIYVAAASAIAVLVASFGARWAARG